MRGPRRRLRPQWPRLPHPARDLTLSDEWRSWVVDNALDGVPHETLLRTLVTEGVPVAVASREVAALSESPLIRSFAQLRARTMRLEMVLALRRSLESAIVQVPRRRSLPADEFYAHYFAANAPVILTDAMARWPALGKWSPAWFKDRFADVAIEVCVGRASDPDCDMNYDAHRTTMTMASYVDLLVARGETNDHYAIAHNRNMARSGLEPLFDDIVLDEEYFDPAMLRTAVSLWLGPAGTVTPLHHDRTNVFFGQVYGSKRVTLVSPLETALLEGIRGVYSDYDLRRLASEAVLEVVLVAGETLFIPAGWWHRVQALEPSINFSLLNFRRPNDFSSYQPGAGR